MLDESQTLARLIENRERDFFLGKAKVSMRASIENLEVGDFRIDELKSGEATELPMWVAEELASLGLADIIEEPFEEELLRALSKEKLMGPLQVSGLQQDFYLRMRRRVVRLSGAVADGKAKKEDLDRVKTAGYDLTGMRLSKLLSLSSSASASGALFEKLTPEEVAFFRISQNLSKTWRSALLGGNR